MGESVFTFPADPLNGCNNFNDTIGGSYAIDADGNAVQAGGGEQAVQINFSLPVSETQGQQPPTLILDEIPANMRWQAIGVDDTEPGQVDSWTLTNGRAVGTASFMGSMIGSGVETGIVAGEFEILCAPLAP